MMRRKICAAVALVAAGMLAFGSRPAMADDAPAYTLPSRHTGVYSCGHRLTRRVRPSNAPATSIASRPNC